MIEFSTIIISRAKREDLQKILTLQKLSYNNELEMYGDLHIPPLTQDLESIREEYKSGIILKANISNEIVGSVRAHYRGDTCIISKLVVKPVFQNNGIAKILMGHIEKLCNEVSTYELFTVDKSERNLRFYNNQGYKIFKREKINDIYSLVYFRKPNYINAC